MIFFHSPQPLPATIHHEVATVARSHRANRHIDLSPPKNEVRATVEAASGQPGNRDAAVMDAKRPWAPLGSYLSAGESRFQVR